MVKFASIDFIVFYLLTTSPAVADWQYTKWGMSIDEVMRASGNALRAPTPKEKHDHTLSFADRSLKDLAPDLIGNYNTDSFRFNAVFYFGGNQKTLSRIELHLIDHSKLRPLLAALRSLYGEPLQSSNDSTSSMMRWRDEKNSNEVLAFDLLSNMFTLTYTILPSAKGL
jgi:hypothetical protein